MYSDSFAEGTRLLLGPSDDMVVADEEVGLFIPREGSIVVVWAEGATMTVEGAQLRLIDVDGLVVDSSLEGGMVVVDAKR